MIPMNSQQGLDQSMDDINQLIEMVEEFGTEILSDEELEIYQQATNQSQDDNAHYANLAEKMDKGNLISLAQDVEQWVEDDEESRKEWQLREADGIKAMGMSGYDEDRPDELEGTSQVTHPLLAEAVVQFNSRSIAEMWPPEGPVKTKTAGKPTAESDEQQDRVSEYLLFPHINEMPGAFEEEDEII